MNKYLSQKADCEKIPETDRTSGAELKVASCYEVFLKEVQRKHYKLMPEVQALANSLTNKDKDLAEERRQKEEAQNKYAQKAYRQRQYDSKMESGQNRKGKKQRKRFHR